MLSYPADVTMYPVPDIAVLRRYGMTPARYVEILQAQGWVCALCLTYPKGKTLVVDHDHNCCPGRNACGSCVRGLLCHGCNVNLGFYERWKTDPRVYLNSWPSRSA